MKVPWWAWLSWGVMFLVMEGFALANSMPGDTLTETLHTGVPGWLVFSFLGWLAFHLVQTYTFAKRDGR